MGIILPRYIKYRAWLLEEAERLLLYVRWVPYQNVRLIAAGGDQSVRFVPARAHKMALSSEESLDFALDVPDASYVVVSTGEQELALVAPLY